jgi:rhamnose utilization protein RhaD (predicted bifunctional aldolase and dehydrogenase)
MRNLWNDQDLPDNAGYLEERVYSSRLLGKNPDLVLHGGGNTSVKGEWINIYGDREQALFVKGSGSDLATIELKDFVPVRLEAMLTLSQLDVLSDIDMARELRLATLDLNSPAPSVETILHALIPYKFVDHTHADVILAITNTALGNVYLREIYGDDIIVLPYVMAGFDLAKLCAKEF